MTDQEQIKELTGKLKLLEETNTALKAEIDKLNPPDMTEDDLAVLKLIAADSDGMQHYEIMTATKWSMGKVVHHVRRLNGFHFTEFTGGGDEAAIYKLGKVGAVFLAAKGLL